MMKISLGGEFDDRQYNCTVNNPLTQESAVFFAKDCYPGKIFVLHFYSLVNKHTLEAIIHISMVMCLIQR